MRDTGGILRPKASPTVLETSPTRRHLKASRLVTNPAGFDFNSETVFSSGESIDKNAALPNLLRSLSASVAQLVEQLTLNFATGISGFFSRCLVSAIC